ncbi:MAG: T9SS C-terminal target domain-containing protein, partial [Bacteroidetes bacterium]|nr:T9SS C-terminal target domain-containing protein [Bacteroidota bacterium]
MGQEIGAYKTRVSGDFNLPATWEVWNGSNWVNATQKPGSTTDIYVDRGHTLRLLGAESVKSLYLHAGAGAGQKLNLNNFNLDVYGVLAAFSGSAPGQPRGAWNSQNWIGNSPNSTLTFKGQSRVIVDKASWSAQTTQSRFGVIFDPDPGQELTLEAPFKALSFQVRSGTLYQKNEDPSRSSPCHTLSFNTENSIYGPGPFGTFTVEGGATFRSACSSQILQRTGASPALRFDLQKEATLLLEGQAPVIEAANFLLDGTLIFRGIGEPVN